MHWAFDEHSCHVQLPSSFCCFEAGFLSSFLGACGEVMGAGYTSMIYLVDGNSQTVCVGMSKLKMGDGESLLLGKRGLLAAHVCAKQIHPRNIIRENPPAPAAPMRKRKIRVVMMMSTTPSC